jgi:hypothetical protein
MANVPIIAAGAEYLIHPKIERITIGDGDVNAGASTR